MGKLTIDDLLNSLKNPNKISKPGILANTKENWSRLGSGDSFSELGLERTALEEFLTEWVKDNPYNNI